MPTAVSLCSGYGGLDLGLELVVGPLTHLVHVEYDKHPSLILAHHWPDVPNLGDLKTADLTPYAGADWLTAGYPCQPFSHAGKRGGADDPRHLWPAVADAIRVVRPRHVLLENVRGHLSLGFGRVLGDLADLGFHARWVCVRAADAGAPHGRARVFIVATAEHADSGGRGPGGFAGVGRPVGGGGVDPDVRAAAADPGAGAAADARGQRHGGGEDTGGLGRLDGPDAGVARERERARPEPGDRSSAAAADPNDGGSRLRRAGKDGRGVTVDGVRDDVAADTPSDGRGEGRAEPAGQEGRPDAAVGCHADVSWGSYAPAIARWERITGAVAPRPTEPGRSGERLSPRFVEWMMGLPAGWVTAVPGLPRNAQLKALGNGVVPQQAALALRALGVNAEQPLAHVRAAAR